MVRAWGASKLSVIERIFPNLMRCFLFLLFIGWFAKPLIAQPTNLENVRIEPGTRVRLKAADVTFEGQSYQGLWWLIGYMVSLDNEFITVRNKAWDEAVRIPLNRIQEIEVSVGGTPYDEERRALFKDGFLMGGTVGAGIGILGVTFALALAEKDIATSDKLLAYTLTPLITGFMISIPTGLIVMGLGSMGTQEHWRPVSLPLQVGFLPHKGGFVRLTWNLGI